MAVFIPSESQGVVSLFTFVNLNQQLNLFTELHLHQNVNNIQITIDSQISK